MEPSAIWDFFISSAEAAKNSCIIEKRYIHLIFVYLLKRVKKRSFFHTPLRMLRHARRRRDSASFS